jgi:hypothetical protein
MGLLNIYVYCNTLQTRVTKYEGINIIYALSCLIKYRLPGRLVKGRSRLFVSEKPILCSFCISAERLLSTLLSVCRCTWWNSGGDKQILIKFDVETFFEKLSSDSSFDSDHIYFKTILHGYLMRSCTHIGRNSLNVYRSKTYFEQKS